MFTNFFNIIREIFITNPIAQSIGFIAFFISVYIFLFCKDKKFILFTWISSLVWGVHFFLIWLFSASLINFVDVFKNFFALKFKNNKYFAWFFIIFYLIVWYFSYESPISIIPVFNALLSTLLVFFVRGIWLNIWFIFIVILWVTYNFIWHSIWGFMTDITLFISWIIWILRIFKTKKSTKN